jgi:hypothetical protein
MEYDPLSEFFPHVVTVTHSGFHGRLNKIREKVADLFSLVPETARRDACSHIPTFSVDGVPAMSGSVPCFLVQNRTRVARIQRAFPLHSNQSSPIALISVFSRVFIRFLAVSFFVTCGLTTIYKMKGKTRFRTLN